MSNKEINWDDVLMIRNKLKSVINKLKDGNERFVMNAELDMQWYLVVDAKNRQTNSVYKDFLSVGTLKVVFCFLEWGKTICDNLE